MFPKMDVIVEAEWEWDQVPDDIDAYGYLQGVYQGRWPYEPHRVRAARECLPFERPKLAVTAIIDHPEDFAIRLHRAIQRSRQPRAIEAQPVDVEPIKLGPVGPRPTPMSARFPTIRRRV